MSTTKLDPSKSMMFLSRGYARTAHPGDAEYSPDAESLKCDHCGRKIKHYVVAIEGDRVNNGTPWWPRWAL
jgi:hypothetical protein